MALNEGFYIHMVTYMVLAILWKIVGLKDIYSLVIAMLTGTILEIVQLFLPNRYLSLNDILANLLGAFLGYVLIKAIPYLDRIKVSTHRLTHLKNKASYEIASIYFFSLITARRLPTGITLPTGTST